MSQTDYLELVRLAEEFWRWRAYHQPNSSDDIPRIERPRNWKPDWSQAGVEKQRVELSEFERQLESIESSNWPISQQVDHKLIGSALARVRWELDVLQSWRRNPRFYVYQALGQFFEDLLKTTPLDNERAGNLVTYLNRVPGVLAEGKTNLADSAVRPFASVTIEILKDIRAKLQTAIRGLEPKLVSGAERIDQVADEAISELESFRDWLQARLSGMSDNMAAGREGYVFFLRNVALMPFTPEELLTMGRQEWERSIAAEAIAKQRARGLPQLEIVRDQATQMALEEQAEGAIRDFLKEQDLLTVPVWLQHYRNLPLPAYLEPLGELGVLDDLTSASRLDQNGVRYIPHPSPNLGYFELSAARDPRPLIVHEGVPGHYLQMSLAWAHENPIRRHYYDSGPNEGIGFYAEEMMLQAGLFDDSPRAREIIQNFMRLRALRVEVDVKLALGLFDIDQATDYLRTRTPMDYETARAEAISFASLPGQAITYQIGKLQILSLIAEARESMAENFNLREFHDYLWKNGNVPIALLSWEYLGRS
jgi:hypothetical protein